MHTLHSSVDGKPTSNRIQILTKKPTSDHEAMATRAFGGHNLGLNGEGWEVCQRIFNFHYMGAAEYEFGAIPTCLRAMAVESNAGDLVTWSMTFTSSEISTGYWRRDAMDAYRRKEIADAKARGEKPPRMTPKHKAELQALAGAPIPPRVVHIVASRKQDHSMVEQLIRLAQKDKIHSKNGPRFYLDTDPSSDLDSRMVGWLDLDNELVWFTDDATHESFCEAFGVKKRDAK